MQQKLHHARSADHVSVRQRRIQRAIAAVVRLIEPDTRLQRLLQRGGIVFKNGGHDGGFFRAPDRTAPKEKAEKQYHPQRRESVLHGHLQWQRAFSG